MIVLSETEAIAIADKYGITIDPSDVTQYKLLQIIKMHEDDSPALQELIERCNQRILDRLEMKQ